MKVLRWAKRAPFNPVSSKQVLQYLQLRGYKIPKDRKTRKPTTNDEALNQILRNARDPILELVLEARGLSKALGYLGSTAVGADGRFHPIYTFRPETGRLSSVRPNMQNIPKGGVDAELARAIRSCIIPSCEGKVLLECDWKAMEAVLTGYFAGDDEYIAASQKDSHSWFAGYLLQASGDLKEVPSPKSEDFLSFAAWVKKEHKELRALAKKVNLATGYGMRAPLLASTLHCTVSEAKRYLEIKAKMAPKLEAWKEATWREAHAKGYLETPFGYCVAPATRILTADLRWVRADNLQLGDSLLALEEEPLLWRSRHYSQGKVCATREIITHAVEVRLSDNSVLLTTPEHPWLVDSPRGGYRRWVATQDLKLGYRVLKPLQVWSQDTSRDAGWLAGFYDGEGSWTRQTGSRGGASHLTLSQLPNSCLATAEQLLQQRGFSYTNHPHRDCRHLRINGGLAEQMRFVGSIRPERLLQKVAATCVGEVQSRSVVKVLGVRPIGLHPIVQLQTTTGTYFGEGFAMHNCNYYSDVLNVKDGKASLGKEANEALAFRPQSSGAAMLRETMLALDPWDGKLFDFLVPIHDAILVECWEKDVEEAKNVICSAMGKPWPELGGLVIEADATAGLRWSDMEAVE